MFMRFVFGGFLYKSICCGYSFELHRQVDAIQMGTHNICLYKEVDKKSTGCNLKTTELLDCVLIGVCAVIRSNTVVWSSNRPYQYTYIWAVTWENVSSGPEVIKLFSCSTQLSMKFVLLIYLKLLTILNSFLLNIADLENFSVNKYENANRENFMLSWVEHEKKFITSGPDIWT